MKRIVFFSTPARGHINAVYPVIAKLVKSGFCVDWYCTEAFRETVEKTGARFIRYRIDFDRYSLSEMTADFYQLYRSLLMLNREAYTDCLGEIKQNKPDLILYDSMCSFAKNIAKRLSIKSVCFCTTMAYNAFTFLFSNMFLPTVKLMCRHLVPIVRLYREEAAFRKANQIIRLDPMDLFVNKGDLTIVFMPRELQPFSRTFPKSFLFAGTTIRDRLSEKTLYSRYDVYISLGTIMTENDDLYRIVNSPLLQGKKAIMTVGSLKLSGANHIEFVRSTDQMSLLPNVELFINHGGINSIFESLYFGVFQISIPQQEEQRMNAIMSDRKKLGLYVRSLDSLTPEKLERKKARCAGSIKKYQQILREYNGAEIACESVKKLLSEQ